MRRLIAILLLLTGIAFADDAACRQLYDDFMSALEPQITELCMTSVNGVFSYKFYLKDSEGYHNMDLVFGSSFSYLYMDGDNNPFTCDKNKVSHETQKPEDIVKTIFLPKSDCSDEFKKSIGIIL